MVQYLNKIRNRIRDWIRYFNFQSLYLKIIKAIKSFAWRYSEIDHTEVTLYTDEPGLFDDYKPARSLEAARGKRSAKVSFIATAFNESSTAELLLRGIFNQTRLPDEIIITDTGSQDGTRELLESLAVESPVPMQIHYSPGANIAEGRNLAISQARHPIIAVSDFGCVIPKDWLENLVAPFEDEPKTQVSFGRYIAIDENRQAAKWILGWSLENIQPQEHLPSAVSIAFRKQAWEKVGGYPEWLSLTGEDTCFAMELKRSTTLWAFVPDAYVEWFAPRSVTETLRKSYRWSTGDGEAGTNVKSYRWVLIKLSALAAAMLVLISLIMVILFSGYSQLQVLAGILILAGLIFILVRIRKRKSTVKDEMLLTAVYLVEILGFMNGMARRSQVDHKRMESVRGVIFILAGVPIDDTGGGARWTQLALEFLRRQYLVFFINKFPKYESKDLNLEYRHPNLVTKEIADFYWPAMKEKYKPAFIGKPVIGLVELPLADYLPVIENIHAVNGLVIYDLLDAWDTSLGGDWYNSQVEQHFIEGSDLLFATVEGLAERLASRTDKKVHLVPNAVNDYLFNPERSYDRPEDLPAGDWTIIYIGALWGEWFDWDLLKKISIKFPHADLVVIGDRMGLSMELPANVHLIGLKPQRDLPAYLCHSRVAIVPWKVNPITQMTSPLKVYEYIAMYNPVVAPLIDPLNNIPGVFQVKDHSEFVEMIRTLKDFRPPEAEMAHFIRQNNWQARVDQIFKLTDQARGA
jgi:glycosyltransferase involved in cell wall biosynthesis